MKTLKLITAIAAIVLGGNAAAQSTGGIKGTVSDEKGNGLPFATIALMEDATIISGISADEKGDFSFKQLTPGLYNIQISYVGYKTQEIKGFEVSNNKTSYLYRSLNVATSDTLIEFELVEKLEQSILDPKYSTITPIDIEQINSIPSTKSDVISLIVALAPGVTPTPDGKDLYIRGARRGTAAYYVDGNRIMGTPDVPGTSIGAMEVLTGGMPAEYGDCTGGVVVITTKDYKWEMRRKQMEKTARHERELEEKKQKKNTE